MKNFFQNGGFLTQFGTLFSLGSSPDWVTTTLILLTLKIDRYSNDIKV